MHSAHVLLDYRAECTHMACSSDTQPCCCKRKETRKGTSESNPSSPGQQEPSQKAGWEMPPERQGQQADIRWNHASLSQDLISQRKYMGIFTDFDVIQKYENSLSPRSSLYWQVEQMTARFPFWTVKHKAVGQRSIQCSLSHWENASIHTGFRSWQTSPSPFGHSTKEMVSWKVHAGLCAFFPLATHIMQFSEKRDSKMWSQVKERGVNGERERTAERASISEGRSLSPRTGFPLGLSLFFCLELRSLKKMFPLWISNEFPLNLERLSAPVWFGSRDLYKSVSPGYYLLT